MDRLNYGTGRAKKKLKEAAEWLARGGSAVGSSEEAVDDLEAFGAPPEIARGLEEKTTESFDIWPENAAAIFLYMRVQTQWIIAPNGARGGLSYPAVEVAARASGATMTPELFSDVQTMEFAALRLWAKQREERDSNGA